MKSVRHLLIRFTNTLAPHEVPLFRGAVNAMTEERRNLLFHNHTDEGFRYSYPLIQYKRIGGKAAILCIEEGVDVIGELFSTEAQTITIGDRAETLCVETVQAGKTLVQVWDSTLGYRIRGWLPFNPKNYAEYQEQDSLATRIALLERILTGNILSFLKGIAVRAEKQVLCSITSLQSPRLVRYKGVKMMSFDADFKTNVSLPLLAGIGKNASVGFGTVTRNKHDNTTKHDNNRETTETVPPHTVE